jgi:hypothetical protein
MERSKNPRRRTVFCANDLLFVWCAVALFLVVSCSSTAMNHANEDSFNLVVENFHNAVRWGEYEAAATFVGPTMQEDFWRIADALQNRVSITECLVKRSAFDRNGRSGSVVLFVRYSSKGNPEVITRTIHERWAFTEKDKMWRLVSHDLNTLGN